jgi:phage terminase large subunit-like protein
MDLALIQKQIDELDAQIANPTPTAPIGTTVRWYKRANPEDCYAALVTKVEAAGKLTVTVFPPFGMPTHTRGCLHISHEIHKQRSHTVSVNSGAWDYLEGQKPPKGHFEMDVAVLTKRRDALLEQLAEAKVVAEKDKKTALAR